MELGGLIHEAGMASVFNWDEPGARGKVPNTVLAHRKRNDQILLPMDPGHRALDIRDASRPVPSKTAFSEVMLNWQRAMLMSSKHRSCRIAFI